MLTVEKVDEISLPCACALGGGELRSQIAQFVPRHLSAAEKLAQNRLEGAKARRNLVVIVRGTVERDGKSAGIEMADELPISGVFAQMRVAGEFETNSMRHFRAAPRQGDRK